MDEFKKKLHIWIIIFVKHNFECGSSVLQHDFVFFIFLNLTLLKSFLIPECSLKSWIKTLFSFLCFIFKTKNKVMFIKMNFINKSKVVYRSTTS